jgi:transposase
MRKRRRIFYSSYDKMPMQANALITSHDLIAFEDLKIANMVRNHHLAKSINDAAWSQFLTWVCAYGAMHAIPIVKVAPHYTSQDCSACGTRIKKSLSARTHICTSCGVVLDRDQNAARNILEKAEEGTVGHTGTAERDSVHASGQGTATSCSWEQGASLLIEGRIPLLFTRGSVKYYIASKRFFRFSASK